MTWPAVLSWALVAICMLPSSPVPLLYLFFGLGAFTSLTLYPGEGGPNLVPQAVCAGFLVLKAVLTGGRLPRALDAAVDPAKLNLLFVFLAYAVFTAYVMPRLFARMVEVVPLNSSWPEALMPIAGNTNQSVYLTLSVGVVLAFFLEGQDGRYRRHYIQALAVAGMVLTATGIADVTLSSIGLADILQPFRSAKYALLTEDTVGAGKRIVGLTPEASSYGSACVAAAATLAFLRPSMENRWWRDRLAPLIIACLIAMAIGSKSSTAYGGLGIFGAMYAANWLRRAFSPHAPAKDQLKWEAIAAVAAFVMFLGVVAFMPDLMEPIYNRIEKLIVKKTETSSYEDRTMVTLVALNAFYFTYGLGVGLGSTMTSSWFVAILSNTGIFGALLFFGFVLRLYVLRCSSSNPRTNEIVIGLKYSLVPVFAMLAVAGTTPDMGVGVASTLGMIASLTSPDMKKTLRPWAAAGRRIDARNRP
ncbi:MAG: hypothetical protein L0Y50_00725 [Beijerinckiaceae bacterium]|nr:hypothetical protein [Beijerinckiaceae bacterium]MCI0734797.1 hypothetical protein [Beijerinckiaceae bacterium]